MTAIATIEELAARPVPIHRPDPGARSYRLYPVDESHPMLADPLVRASDFGLAGESYYRRTDGLNAPYYRALPGAPRHVWVRRAVAERLARANEMLNSAGLEFFLLDGYRSIACQQGIYDWMLEHAMTTAGIANVEAAKKYIDPYISDPSVFRRDDSTTWISHITGGAIDLVLRRVTTGEQLFMGGLFDDPHELSGTDWYEKPENRVGSASEREAVRNRRILFWTMIDAGFSNLPSEWWHFDYGDQLWAKNRARIVPGEPAQTAWYAPADLPADFE